MGRFLWETKTNKTNYFFFIKNYIFKKIDKLKIKVNKLILKKIVFDILYKIFFFYTLL
jgi:hypothetical protein